jgi:RecA/RadA recombinase
MAKKKSANDKDDKKEKKDKKSFSNPIDEILEKYGNVVQQGAAIASTKQIVIPVTPALDIGLGGGIPEGSFNILCGPQKGGKTLLALWIAANAQQHYDKTLCPNGRNIYFFGIEGRLKPRDLQGIPHLDLSKFRQIVSEPGNILTAEKSLDAADMVIRGDPGCVVIID